MFAETKTELKALDKNENQIEKHWMVSLPGLKTGRNQ